MERNRKMALGGRDKFVTVVSVDKNEPHGEIAGEFSVPQGKHQKLGSLEQEKRSVDEGVSPLEELTRPQPAPRQFVTVVSVGGTEKLELCAGVNASLESNMSVRLDVPGEKEDSSKDTKEEEDEEEDTEEAGVNCVKGRWNESGVPDQVVVFRLPGERLGLGLKFDGGMAVAEKVRRLFIQSVAPDSPAARATVPWGDLEVGDQILHIEGRDVSSMTRVECVSLLKEASVKLTIGVLKGNGSIPETEDLSYSPPSLSKQARFMGLPGGGGRSKRVPPPPLPPRLRPRKSPARPPKDAADWPPPPHGFEDFDTDEPLGKVARVSRNSSFSDELDGEVLAFLSPSHRHAHMLPPTPAVYLDLLSEEDKASRARCESESDETNSSASTVVDRLSISSSRTVSRNSSFNAAADAAKFDLARALSPFEHLEKEFNTEKRQRSLSTPHLTSNEYTSSPIKTSEVEQEGSEHVETQILDSDSAPDHQPDDVHVSKSSPKAKGRPTMKSLSFSLKSRPFSWHYNKQSNEEKSNKPDAILASKKSAKRLAPLPPPRSVSGDSPTSSSVVTSQTKLHEGLVVTTVENPLYFSKPPEYIDISAECENVEVCDVFENDDFPSIVEKGSKYSLQDDFEDPSKLSGGVHSSLLDSILRETKTRLENMKEDIFSSEKEALEEYSSGDQSFESSTELRGSEISEKNDTSPHGTPPQNDNIVNNMIYDGHDEQFEPLNMETYDSKSEFFIDRVSNPTYGFPPLTLDPSSLSSRSQTEDDQLYEDVNDDITQDGHQRPIGNSMFAADKETGSKQDDDIEQDIEVMDTERKLSKHSDLSSLSSCSLSTISLSSRELEEMRESVSLSDLDTLDSDDIPNKEETPTDAKQIQIKPIPTSNSVTEALKDESQYDYMNILPANRDVTEASSVPKRFSQISSHVRLREDIGDLLREELELESDAHVEVEEEEVVESVVECETKEEILMVLRALRSDNAFTLSDGLEKEVRCSADTLLLQPATAEDIGNPSFDLSGISYLRGQRSGHDTAGIDTTQVNDSVTPTSGVASSNQGRDLRVKPEAERVAPIAETKEDAVSSLSECHINDLPTGNRIRSDDYDVFEREGPRGPPKVIVTGDHEDVQCTSKVIAMTDSSPPEANVLQGDAKLPTLTFPPDTEVPQVEVTQPLSSVTAEPVQGRLSSWTNTNSELDAFQLPSVNTFLGGIPPTVEEEEEEDEEEDVEEEEEGERRSKREEGEKDRQEGKALRNKDSVTVGSRLKEVPEAPPTLSCPPPAALVCPRDAHYPLPPGQRSAQRPPSDLSSSSGSQGYTGGNCGIGNEPGWRVVSKLVIPPKRELGKKSHTTEHLLSGNGTNVTLYEQRFSSTSSSQASPPTYSRLPPDGHEFPSSYSEGLQDKIDRIVNYSLHQETEGEAKSPTGGNPSTLPRSPPKLSSSSSAESRSTSRWRRQDERSEKSVRDKIAMFSSDKEKAKTKNRRVDRSESVNSGRSEKTCMKRSLTEDDVRVESEGRDIKLSKDSSEKQSSSRKQGKPYSSMINVHSSHSDSKENVKPASSESDVRDKTPKLNKDSEVGSKLKLKGKQKPEDKDGLSGLNSRSQSLIDIGKSSRMKRHSVGAYDRPSVYKYGVEKPEDRERRTSLNNLIEQRRKSMSKLRGLVIPEARAKDASETRLPLDLPRISSNTSAAIKTMSLPRDESRISNLYKADSVSSIDSCSSSASRHSNTHSSYGGKGITKLSPAHNRKHSFGASTKSDSLPPLRSRSARNQSPLSDFSGSTSTLTTLSPQRSFDRSLTPNSETSSEMDKYSSERSLYSRNYTSTKSSQDSRLCRSEDSDNDSAVSSTQSSFSQSLSPRASPMPDHYDQDDRHSPTRSSRSRHSPQSSFDELDPKRILKSGSIEAENRRNILKSAKCSSGRSSDEQSTPEIVRKFSKDRTPEPHSFPDRLDSELREGPKKMHLRREDSIESSSSISSHQSSLDSSRRNSKDSVIHNPKSDIKVSAQAVYFDREGDMYKESQVKVAYLNEIVDDYEELPNDRGNVVAEVPMQTRGFEATRKNSATYSILTDTKWNALEQKYSSQKLEHESIDNKISKYISSSDSVSTDRYRYGVKTTKTDFRALADKWKQRTEEDAIPPKPRSDSITKIEKPVKREDSPDILKETKRYSKSEKISSESSSTSTSPDSSARYYDSREERPSTLDLPRIDIPDRKFSVPEYVSGGLKLREKREVNSGDVPSRPTSLIEGTVAIETLQQQQDGQYMTPASPSSTSTDSREDLVDSSEASLSRTGSKEILDAFSKPVLNSSVSPKMSEFMRAFERHDMNIKSLGGSHPRMSSLDLTAGDDGLQGTHYGSISSLASGQRDQYGSITSLSSSTSIISPQELAQLIEEANHSLEESGTPSHEILVVVLHREIVAQGSIGITLAGGADYETKEITVHKVIPGSLADRDGQIQKGDRILSINGKTLRGVSHREALNILKSPRPEVVLVLSRSRSVTPQESTVTQSNGDAEGGFSHRSVFINHVPPPRPPKILESPMDSKSLVSDLPVVTVPRGPAMNISLIKDGAGVGFSLEGGKDSPLGDRPLTVKKVFSGGAADKGGVLKVGDELLGVNSVDLTNMARIEAWNFLKKLPDGKINLVIRQKLKEEEAPREKEKN